MEGKCLINFPILTAVVSSCCHKVSSREMLSVPSFLACVCDERCDLVIVPPLLLSNCIVDCGASLQWPAAGWAGLFREKLHFISFLIVAADNV